MVLRAMWNALRAQAAGASLFPLHGPGELGDKVPSEERAGTVLRLPPVRQQSAKRTQRLDMGNTGRRGSGCVTRFGEQASNGFAEKSFVDSETLSG
jgi:hypothetical protein